MISGFVFLSRNGVRLQTCIFDMSLCSSMPCLWISSLLERFETFKPKCLGSSQHPLHCALDCYSVLYFFKQDASKSKEFEISWIFFIWNSDVKLYSLWLIDLCVLCYIFLFVFVLVLFASNTCFDHRLAIGKENGPDHFETIATTKQILAKTHLKTVCLFRWFVLLWTQRLLSHDLKTVF